MPLLELHDLTKDFGGVRAVNDLNLWIEEGEILGLIGPNGAGKSTVFNLISGLLSPSGGEVRYQGEKITGLPPHIVAKRGIVRTFQAGTLFNEMTVLQNICLGLHLVSGIGFWGSVLNNHSTKNKEKTLVEKAVGIAESAGMGHLIDQLAGTLSHGWQRTLSFAIAVATKPRLLLLDEPVTALNPERVKHILNQVKKAREEGSTVLIIEHNMRVIFDICDRIAVMNYGTKIADGTPLEIKDDPVVVEAYLGTKKGVT